MLPTYEPGIRVKIQESQFIFSYDQTGRRRIILLGGIACRHNIVFIQQT